MEHDAKEKKLTIDQILIGAGRQANVEGMDLEKAAVQYDKFGVKVNDQLQTTNKNIYAAGDICMMYKFTHAADFAARIVIQNALFHGRKKLSALTIPWCTYTEPEIAHVGLYEKEAKEQGMAVATFTRFFKDVDRAILDGAEEGFVKIHVKKGTDKIIGGTIVGQHAGDMISELSVAVVNKIGLGRLANVIHPYPTVAEAIRQAADMYNRNRLTPFIKRLFKKWLSWTR
jgi:pyruvate/2-oxoglutarate dehydrogenase complex dihydrolipoamide dehydrogenase (E3) component